MRLVVYGSKEFAATVAELIRHCGHEPVGMIDDYQQGSGILGDLKVVSTTHPPDVYGVAMAIGYNNLAARWDAWTRVKALGYHAPPLIHPRAYVADTANVADGALVMAGALVDVRAKIGELAVVWPGACVSHDAYVGDNCFLSPNATICGHVNVGKDSFVGAGAVLVDHCNVPERSFIKALERVARRPS